MPIRYFSTGVETRDVTSVETCFPYPFTARINVAGRFGRAYLTSTAGGKARCLKEGRLLPLNPYVRFDCSWRAEGNAELTWPTGCNGPRTASIAVHPFDGLGVFPLTDQQAMLFDDWVQYPTSAQQDLVLQEAYAKFWEGFDALTFLGEFGQTVMLLKGARERMLRLLTDIPRILKQRDAAKTAKTASGMLLEWNFGWMQLQRDLEDITDMLLEIGQSNVFKGRAKADVILQSQSFSVDTAPGGFQEYATVLVSDEATLSYRGLAIARRRGAPAGRKSAFFNPVITGYELIPYSWVVDYFFNLGTAIKAFLASLHTVDARAAIGFRVAIQRTVSVAECHKGNLLAYSHSAQGRATFLRKLRTPRVLSLTPVHLTLPKVRQLLNVVAVIFQQWGNGPENPEHRWRRISRYTRV